MSPSADDVPEPVLLIIADISGYTRFMTANARTLAHSHGIITELIKAIVSQIELPLEVAKLEGDAVFLYCRQQNTTQPWSQIKRTIGDKLLMFFRMFSEKVAELSNSTTCNCHVCAHIDQLRLKVVVHSGEVLFHRVFNFVELAGVDVIIVHRLLKNSVGTDQYLLLTEAAWRELEFADNLPLEKGSETYESIGQVNTLVYLPEGRPADATDKPLPKRSFASSAKLFCKLWFAPFASRANFNHISSPIGKLRRIGYAAMIVVLTPFFVPVGCLFAWFHSLRSPKRPHVHKPDGSCCSGH